MKVFEYQYGDGETEWIAAPSVLKAIKVHCELTGEDIFECDDQDEIVEVPEKDWDKLKFTDEDGEKFSLKQFMKSNTTSCIIAGTMFEA